MAIRFSTHVRQRLKQRGISKADVKSVVRRPLTTMPRPGGKPGRCLRGTVGRRTLRVVTTPAEADTLIVTAYWVDDLGAA